MDIFLLVIGFLFVLLGIIGAFLPVLPGPITGWVGLLILHLTNTVPMNWTFIGITLGVSIIIWAIDYIIPALGTKKFGGTKYGVYGTMIGLILGLFLFPPFGIVIGPFVGAFVGEILFDSNNPKKALKAAFGSFIGFLTSTFLKFATAIVFMWFYISIFWEYKSGFIN